MPQYRLQRRVAPPWTEKEHSKPQSYPVSQTKLHTEPQPESQPTEPVLLLGYPPSIPSTTYYSEHQFARMSIEDGAESGESSYRTTVPAPKVFSFKNPGVMEHDEDDDDDSVTCCVMWIEPCKDHANYSSWLQKNFPHLMNKREFH